MCKKFLSIICSLIILTSVWIPVVSLAVKAEELSAGSYPYANEKDSSAVVRNVDTGEIEAYKDFVVKSDLNNLTESDYLNTWRLYNKAESVYKVGSNTLATAALEKYSTDSDNVYSNSGNSIKISYTKTCNSKISPANGTADQYFHFIRQNNYFSIPKDYLDTASISFWVKTEYQTYVVLRLTCNGYDTKDFIISERILVPAGESIVEIPLSNFVTCKSGYTAINQSGYLKVNIADIYFKPTESFEGTRDIYFDNLGFYYYTSNSQNAIHSEDFVLKNDVESLTYTFEENKDKVVDGNGITWRDDDKGNLGVNVDASNAYNRVGSSIYYTTENIYSSNSANYNCVTSNAPYTTNFDGKKIGKDAVVCIWLKSDRALTTYIKALDSSWNQNRYRSSEYFVPAGEFVLKIPLSDLTTQDSASLNCDFLFKWDAFNSLGIYFKSATSTDVTGTKATLYIDKIGIENQGEAEPENPPVPDTVVTHTEDFKEVETLADKWVNKKTENAVLTVEDEAEHYHSIATNLQENKSAIKVAYSNIDSSASNVAFYYNTHLRMNDLAPYIYEEDSVLSFWTWSDQPVNIKVTYMDFDNVAQKPVQCDSKIVTIPAGESIVKIPMSEMAKNGQVLEYRYAYQLQIIILSNEESYSQNGTLFIDSIGFYDKDLTNDIPAIPEIVIPDTIVTHTADFKEVETAADKWINKSSDNATLTVENESEHYHSIATNIAANKSAIKIAYNNIDSKASNVRFYYDKRLSLSEIAPFIYEKDSVLSFWAWSDQSVDIKITYMDFDTETQKTVQCATKIITIPAGESIVKIPMSEMANNNQKLAYRYAYQLQMIVLSNEESIAKSGTLFIDAIGFYDIDPANNIPYVPENVIPDTIATHEIGFSEVALKNELWVNKKAETSAFSFETNSSHYHSGKTNVGNNKEAWKLSYTNLSATSSNVNFYYNDGIRISNSQPYIFGDTSVLSFWTYSEQPIDIKISYMDFSVTAGKSIPCKAVTVSIPAGESIVKIPMKDLAPDGNEMQYRYCYQLQFVVLANSDSYKVASNLWIDAIGFYDSSLVINDTPLTIPDNTYVWWNFDNGNTLEKSSGGWTTRFEGDEGKGISLTLESNSENTYGGKGNSLKVVYDRKQGTNGIPCIWYEPRIIAYGDGLTFWIKSEEKTNIRIVCLDAGYDGIKVDSIPVTIGYNIITVKWSDFVYLDSTMTGTPDMSSVTQFQIRPNGCNNGTFWIDQICFTNITNNGTNAYYSLYPPTNYKKWYEGVSVVGDDFESWPGDDDMKFCSEWFFDETGWISLKKNNNNTILQMDYDFSKNKKSELINVTQFKEVDQNGGISFWAKSSEERYYTLKIWLGERAISVIIKGSTTGRYYKIPFSSFWISNKIGTSFAAEDKSAVTVQRISFITDSTCNPPAMNTSEKCSLWLDDIKFVDSASYKRASKVEHYENGVCLKAPVEAFATGVTVKIDKISLEGKESEYLPKMKDATKVGSLYKIEAIDTRGISVTPQVEVELIFDIPENQKAEEIFIYQKFIDGSLSKRKSSIGDDGKIHLSVYRLGEYLMGFGNEVESNNKTTVAVTEPKKENNVILVVIIVSAVLLAVGGIVSGIIIFRRKGAKK